MPGITDNLDLLKVDDTYCGESEYLLSGNITSISEFVKGEKELSVKPLTSFQIGTYEGLYTRKYPSFNLTLPLKLIVSSPYIIDPTSTTKYELFKDLGLNFRSISYSTTAVEQLFNQIDYLVLNPWYTDLREIYTDKKPFSEKLRSELIRDLEFEYSISTNEIDFSSKLT